MSIDKYYSIFSLRRDKINKLEEKLILKAEEIVTNDFSNEECVRPLNVSLYLESEKLNKLKNDELDFIIDNIKSHGLWDHIGTWGYNNYPEEDSAMIKWVGAESVNNYYLLKINGRLD